MYLIPTVWFRNTWSWGRSGEGYTTKPSLSKIDDERIVLQHPHLDPFVFLSDPRNSPKLKTLLFTENESNKQRLFGGENESPFVKDAFHEYLINENHSAINPKHTGTKAGLLFVATIGGGDSIQLCFQLKSSKDPFNERFTDTYDEIFDARQKEYRTFYDEVLPKDTSSEERNVLLQSYAGLLWTKQFYYYAVKEWFDGDPTQPTPSNARRQHKNKNWKHLYNRDIISVPDKWEYPWYAAWDLAFHMLPFCRIDPEFAKEQLLLLLREWYMHPNGQIPAYEFEFSNVNPPVHAWACWRVYQLSAENGAPDRIFLKRAFTKLLLNFTWWINRTDTHGRNLFSGGFLGLDNIGVFDRSAPLPEGGSLQQADATAWMAFYCGTMLSIALELAMEDEEYEDLASKFFEHFIAISSAMNNFGGTGLWDQLDGFYYDQLELKQTTIPLRVRSLVGIIPLIAVEVLHEEHLKKLPGFKKRLDWFIANKPELAEQLYASEQIQGGANRNTKLLSIPSPAQLSRMIHYILDEQEFLSPYGIRSLSKIHEEYPYKLTLDGRDYSIDYCPGDSNTDFFGGNSNWRGPIWFPVNALIIEALDKYHEFYGDNFTIEYPTGSGNKLTLQAIADKLSARLASLFIPNAAGKRACHGDDIAYASDPYWKDLVLFYEHFHGDNGRGIGASHQTGWTSLVSFCIERLQRSQG